MSHNSNGNKMKIARMMTLMMILTTVIRLVDGLSVN